MRAKLLLFAGLTASAATFQVPPETSVPPAKPAAPSPEFDADIHNLLQVLGLKRKMIENRDQLFADAKAAMHRDLPNVSPAFDEEWERRLRARFNFDDLVDISASIYAKYFTNAEVKQQISFQTSRARHDEKPLAPELQKKIEQVMPDLQKEFSTEAAHYASKLGIAVGAAVAKDHPEWLVQPQNNGPLSL